jgi:type III secretory pathway component EscV
MAEQKSPVTQRSDARDRIDALRVVIEGLGDRVDWTFDGSDLINLAEYVRFGMRRTERRG